MLTEMNTAYLLQNIGKMDPRGMGGVQVMQMEFQNNAQIANLFFSDPLGQLSVGALADIILVDYVPTTPLTAGNFPWHIIFGVDGTGVDTTIVGGQVLMRNKQLLSLDEAEICAKSQELAGKLWKRL